MRFRLQPWQESREDAVVVECPIHDRRHVRSSSGHVEERYVVPMAIMLVGRTVGVEMSLSRRDEMGFRMLVGREALRAHGLSAPGPVDAPSGGPVALTLLRTRRALTCPRCGSDATELVSEFGATACKAMYRCTDCAEPFEHVKEI